MVPGAALINDAVGRFHDASDFEEVGIAQEEIDQIERGLPTATKALKAVLEADNLRLPEALVTQALRVARLSSERAEKVLRNFAAFRAREGWPMRLHARDSELPLRTGAHQILPLPDRAGRQVMVFNAARVDPRVCPIEAFHRMASYVVEELSSTPHAQHMGVTIVFNLAGADMAMARFFSLADVRRGIAMWRDAFPCKVSSVLVVNYSTLQQQLMNISLNLVHERVRARVKLLPTLSELSKYVPAEAVPRELGGALDAEGMWAAWCDAHVAGRSDGHPKLAAVVRAGAKRAPSHRPTPQSESAAAMPLARQWLQSVLSH